MLKPRITLAVALMLTLTVGFLPAQKKKEAAKKKTTAKKAAPKKGAAKKAAPKKAGKKGAAKKNAAKKGKKTASAGSVRDQYEKQLQQWKDLLKSLRSMRLKYLESKDAERVALAQKFTDGIAKGNVMVAKLRAKAKAAYLAAPNEDRGLRNLLIKMAKDEYERGVYESSASLAKTLIDNKCQVNLIYSLAGSSLFSIHKFDEAEKYLKRADATNSLQPPATIFLKEIANYKMQWAEELKFRKQEEADRKDPKKRLPQVVLKTNRGEIVLELFENEAPNTVGNFISLVEKKYYDGLTFHRVLQNFMAQTGCPLGNGTGGPGYNIKDECRKPIHRKHFRGSLSMAKGTAPDTGGSQFFLCFLPTSQLNGKHTVFGRIVKGMDILAKIKLRDPKDKEAPEPDQIISATVINKRNHVYKPDKVTGG